MILVLLRSAFTMVRQILQSKYFHVLMSLSAKKYFSLIVYRVRLAEALEEAHYWADQ